MLSTEKKRCAVIGNECFPMRGKLRQNCRQRFFRMKESGEKGRPHGETAGGAAWLRAWQKGKHAALSDKLNVFSVKRHYGEWSYQKT